MSLSQAHERALIARAQRGDREAVAELYQAHVQPIYRYIFHRVGEAAAAEDLTSEVFLKALEGLGRYEHRGAPLAAWLFRIARDRVSDHHRRRARRSAADLPESLPDPTDEEMEAEFGRRAQAAELRAQIAELTEDQRDVIYWRFIEGLSVENTAAILGKTPGAVKALQHRALNSLARKLR